MLLNVPIFSEVDTITFSTSTKMSTVKNHNIYVKDSFEGGYFCCCFLTPCAVMFVFHCKCHHVSSSNSKIMLLV